MEKIHEELIAMMNKALQLEHAAYIQYLAHAEMISGLNAEPIIERLTEIANDEKGHAEKFRNMIGAYLGGTPTMAVDETFPKDKVQDILEINLKQEKEAVDFYKQIYAKIISNKEQLPYCFETLEHEVRHIILDEQEHITEISLLLGL